MTPDRIGIPLCVTSQGLYLFPLEGERATHVALSLDPQKRVELQREIVAHLHGSPHWFGSYAAATQVAAEILAVLLGASDA